MQANNKPVGSRQTATHFLPPAPMHSTLLLISWTQDMSSTHPLFLEGHRQLPQRPDNRQREGTKTNNIAGQRHGHNIDGGLRYPDLRPVVSLTTAGSHPLGSTSTMYRTRHLLASSGSIKMSELTLPRTAALLPGTASGAFTCSFMQKEVSFKRPGY